MIPGLQNGCCVSRHGNNVAVIVHLYQSSLVTRCIINEQSSILKLIFSVVCLNSGLKILLY
jgi:hypothetical protein